MKRPYLFFVVIAFLSLAADQLSKWWAIDNLTKVGPNGERQALFRTAEHEVIKDYFHFSYAENPGATFSFLAGVPAWVRLPFFATIAALAAIGISVYYTRIKGRKLATRIALPLLWSGAVGNLIDRLRFTYVVDFIDWHYKNQYTWPTFNIADVAIVVGIAIFFIWGEPEEPAPKKAKPATA